MIEKFKSHTDTLLKAVPLVYILGFFVTNGYLSALHYTEYNVLSVTYLKSGALFACFVLIYVVVTYFSFTKETMTDNLLKAWPSMLHSLYSFLFATSLITLILTANMRPTDKSIGHYTIFYLSSVFFIFYYLIVTSNVIIKKIASRNLFLYYVLLSLPFIVFLTYHGYHFLIVRIIFALGFAISLFSFLSFGEIGDKTYSSRIVSDAFLLFVLAFIFGKYVYGELPMEYGGGKPYQIVTSKNFDVFSDTATYLKRDTFHVLYENNDIYILKNIKGENFKVQKSEIKTTLIVGNLK
jgi:hypothetical protein